jgi:replicative DNA helicase
MSDKTNLTSQIRERTGGVRRPSAAELSNPIFGKVQPQALQLEEAVLGAIMLNKDALPVVVDILQSGSFYSDRHQMIYKAMLRLFEKSHPVDLLTMTEELRKAGELEAIGGGYYLVDLTNRVGSSANIEYHARIIAQKHIQRELIRVSTEVLRDAYEETTDVFDLLDSAEKGLFDITQNNLSRGPEGMGSLASQMLKQMEELKDKEEGLTGVPTGFDNFDRLTSGLQPSDLFILAARPGMGKTSFVLALARNAAMDFGKGVAFFSLEMSNLQLVQRLVSLEAEIEGMKMRNGKLEDYEWQQMHTAIEKLSEAPIFIDDTPGINIFELRAKARRLKMQHDIQMVIIDYLQLMSGGGDNQKGNREQEVSAISRALKGLAKELQVPVIALSQLSRAVETRGGTKRPQLSDLRESGSIEQDADMVGFIYRPEYYQILEDEEGNSLKGIGELIIAKNRHGSAETLKMRFISQYAKFANLDDPNFDDLPMDTFSNPVDSGNIMTMPSKMNDSNFTPPAADEDIPF